MVDLCSLDELGDPGALELSWGEGDWPLSLFVVRHGAKVRGYVNCCPHAGHELNLKPNEFLTREGDSIICRSHGAQFRIDDGLCIAGPCPGAFLQPVPIEVVDGVVRAAAAELERLAARSGR